MKEHLNLLPLPFRRRLVIRQEMVRWGCASVVALMVSIGMWLQARQAVEEKTSELAALNEDVRPLRIVEMTNQRLARELDTSWRRHELLLNLEGQNSPAQVLGHVSRSAAQRLGAVQVTSFSLLPAAERRVQRTRGGAVVNDASETGPEFNGQLALQGVAANEQELTEFVEELRDEGFFSSVELRGSSSVTLRYGSARQYSVECRF